MIISDSIVTRTPQGNNATSSWAPESNNVTSWAISGNNVTTTWSYAETDVATFTVNTSLSPVGLKFEDMVQVKVANFLDLWIEAVILFGGVLGNCVLFSVISCSKSYSALSLYLYLKVLAVVDFCSLSITLTTHWVNYNFLPGNKNLYLCKTILFTATQCLDYGACLIATMSVDRLIAIALPLKYKQLCTVKKSAIVAFIMGLGTFGKNIYTFHKAGFSLAKTNKQCAPQYDSDNWLDEMFVWIDLMIGSIIPFLVIVVSNTWLLVAVWKTSHNSMLSSNSKLSQKESQMTALLLLVSSTFLLCTLPRKAYTLALSSLPPPSGMQQVANYRLGHAIATKLWHLNSAINIWLCVASGSRFRRDLMHFVMCGRCRDSQGQGQLSATSGMGAK